MRASRAAALAGAILVTGGLAGASVAWGGTSGTKPQDSFTATVTHAGGAYRGVHGRLSLRLHPRGTSDAYRPVTAVFAGARCSSPRHCVRLMGTLHGSLRRAAARPRPDTGATYVLDVKGTLSPLGNTRVRGTIQGTGFVVRGRESLSLKLSTRRGSVTISGQSGTVPGFTSP